MVTALQIVATGSAIIWGMAIRQAGMCILEDMRAELQRSKS